MKRSSKTMMLCLAALTLLTHAAHAGSDTRLPGPFPVIAAGDTHTLFIRPNGWVHAWGDNTYGQLGDDTNTARFNPVEAQINGAVQVSAGVQFSVALMGDGNIMTWGRNDVGQLGNGTKTTSKTANRIPRVLGTNGEWRLVTAGRAHALAIKIDGTLWGWGDNTKGALGLGANKLSAQTSPQRIGTGADWIAAAAGLNFSVALRADGTLWSTGINDQGQLGYTTATTAGVNVLTQIGAATDRWLKVSAGTSFVAAIKDDGSLWTWGMNDKGQLGDNTTANHTAPARAAGGPFVNVSAGDKHTLAVRWDGVVQATGNNSSGELGIDSTATNKKTLTTLTGQKGEAIAAGKAFSIFLSADGLLALSGLGTSGQLGAGDYLRAPSPFPPFVEFAFDGWNYGVKPNTVSLGTNHTLAIRSLGDIESWGDNRYGQLGPDTSASPSPTPNVQYTMTQGWLQVAGGDYHSMGVRWDGKLFAWGGNSVGELGIGTTDDLKHAPVEVLSGKKAMRAALHYESSLALTADGLMYGWGDNSSGQLGVGSAAGAVVKSPKALSTPSGSRWVALGISNTRGAAVRSDGTLWVWGRMSGTTITYTPVQIGSDKNWVTVALGGADNTTAIKADGRIYAVNGTTATQIATSLRANLISVTHSATLISVSGGRVYGWGDNSMGQQGNGQSFGTGVSANPTFSYFFNPRVLTSGGFFTIQVMSNGGGRQAAGDNQLGQLGIGYAGWEMDDPVIISNGFF